MNGEQPNWMAGASVDPGADLGEQLMDALLQDLMEDLPGLEAEAGSALETVGGCGPLAEAEPVAPMSLEPSLEAPVVLQQLSEAVGGWPVAAYREEELAHEQSIRLEELIESLDLKLSHQPMQIGRPTHAEAVEAPQRRQLLFQVGREWFALPVERTLQVGYVPSITRVPNVSASILGVANLRGEVLPVIQLRTLLSLTVDREPAKPKVVLVRCDGLGSQAALVVDQVKGLTGLPSTAAEAQADPEGTVAETWRAVIAHSVEQDSRRIHVLDLDRLMNLPELKAYQAA